MSQKQKFALYLPAELRSQIDRWYTADNCASVNEFILKAVQFYLSHLVTSEQNTLLPTAISSAIEGRLGAFEDRMARLMFKQAVELATVQLALADALKLTPQHIDQYRAWCIDAVKRTNGRLSFRNIADV